MNEDQQNHWENVYQSRSPDRVSWYAPHLTESLALIDAAQLPPDAAVIDVGGGASTLAADLLARGFAHLTVLDLSSAALAAARDALAPADAAKVTWRVGDVTTVALPEAAYDLWHDRAVFHFLTTPEAQAAYLAQVQRALKPGGRLIVATFAPHGPERCSGLPVVRYDDVGLLARFGADFERIQCVESTHQTPAGAEQAFVHCLCRRRAP